VSAVRKFNFPLTDTLPVEDESGLVMRVMLFRTKYKLSFKFFFSFLDMKGKNMEMRCFTSKLKFIFVLFLRDIFVKEFECVRVYVCVLVCFM